MVKINFNNRLIKTLPLMVLVFLVMPSCTKIEREPKVRTDSVTDITTTSAVVVGRIIDLGIGITDYGHCWSLSENPSITDYYTSKGRIYSTDAYTSELSNLQPGTKYYTKAYATDGSVINYGSVLSFTTIHETGSLTDIDGNNYITVKIGNQWWMAENLKTIRYNNGTIIPNVTDKDAWSSLISGGYCWYNNDIANKSFYGALYNWHAVNTARLCPAGWHVPTDNDWTILVDYAGGSDIAGINLKEAGISHWVYYDYYQDTRATNETGFTALPGGFRNIQSTFYSLGSSGYWWSATESQTDRAWARSLYSSSPGIWRINDDIRSGFSVRCIKIP